MGQKYCCKVQIFFLVFLALGFLFVSTDAQGETIGYWRFEEGTAGEQVPAEVGDPCTDNMVLDISGNENHMRAFDAPFSPYYSNDVPFSQVPGTTQADTLSLDFTSNPTDIYTDATTGPKMINTYRFGPDGSNAWTVEFSFKAADNYGNANDNSAGPETPYQAWVGKDHGFWAPLSIITVAHPNNRFELRTEMLDGRITATEPDGRLHIDIGSRLFSVDEWISVVAHANDTTLKLYANVEGRGWELLAVNNGLQGAMTDNFDGSWRVGRGWHNHNVVDYVRGLVDELRVSDTVVDRDNWLVPADLIFEGPEYERTTTVTGSVEFETTIVEADNSDFTFQWYKSDDPNVTPAQDTVVDSNVTDTNTSSLLAISDVVESDAGYYYCEITDVTAGETYLTGTGELVVRKGRVLGDATVSGDIFSSSDVSLPDSPYYAVTINSEPNTVQNVSFAEWTPDHPFYTETIGVGGLGSSDMNWNTATDDDKAFEDIAGTFRFSDDSVSFNAQGLLVGEEYDVYLLFALGDDRESRSMQITTFGNIVEDDTVATFDLIGGQEVGAGNPAPAKIVSFTATPDEDGNIWGEVNPYDSNEPDDPNIGSGYEANGSVLSGAIVVGPGALNITRQPHTQVVSEGETAEFETEATGVGNLEYTWYYNENGQISSFDSVVGSGPVLTIDNAGVEDEGYYYCRITVPDAPEIEAVTQTATLGVKRLQAHWTLDEEDFDGMYYLDQAGNWDAWEISGFPTFIPGVIGDAVQMSEYEGWADVDSLYPSEFTGQITVSFWLNWDGPTNRWQTFVGKRVGWTTEDAMWQFSTDQRFSNLWFESTYYSQVEMPGGLEDDGQWQHIVGTFDGEVARMYVNGELQAENAGWGFGSGTDAPIYIGAGEDQNGIWYANGAMDDVRIYNYALDQSQVAQLYYDATGEVPCINPPAAHLDMNNDCVIDTQDLAELMLDWLESGRYGN